MSIVSLLNALPGAVAQGLIWGIMAIGVYITFRILDIADLTVDGTLCTGGASAGCFDRWSSGRYGHRSFTYLYGNPGNPGRNPDTAWTVFCEFEDYGKIQSGDQC